MEKCLFNGLEDGGVYQFRTTPFDCIDGFESILSDFDNMYESYQDSATLFSFSKDDKQIVLKAETYTLTFFTEDIDMYDEEALITYLKENGMSQTTIEIICSMVEDEDFSVIKVVEKIAKPNQNINIQMTDTLYGNSEFDLTT